MWRKGRGARDGRGRGRGPGLGIGPRDGSGPGGGPGGCPPRYGKRDVLPLLPTYGENPSLENLDKYISILKKEKKR